MGRGRRSEIVCEIVCEIECAAHLMRRVRRLEREAAQVGHQPLRVAGWCPAHLRVPEEFDHMGLPRQRRPEIRPRARPRGGRAVRACPRDVERDVKGGEGEAEREDLKADQVRGQDRGRFNEGELVRLVGDEVAMLLRRPRQRVVGVPRARVAPRMRRCSPCPSLRGEARGRGGRASCGWWEGGGGEGAAERRKGEGGRAPRRRLGGKERRVWRTG